MVVVTSRGNSTPGARPGAAASWGNKRSGRPTATALAARTSRRRGASRRLRAPTCTSWTWPAEAPIPSRSCVTTAPVATARLVPGQHGAPSARTATGSSGGAGTDGSGPRRSPWGLPTRSPAGRTRPHLGRLPTRRGLRQVFGDDHDEVQFLVSFGCNASGQLGLGDLVARSQPAAVQGVSLVGRSRMLRRVRRAELHGPRRQRRRLERTVAARLGKRGRAAVLQPDAARAAGPLCRA